MLIQDYILRELLAKYNLTRLVLRVEGFGSFARPLAHSRHVTLSQLGQARRGLGFEVL